MMSRDCSLASELVKATIKSTPAIYHQTNPTLDSLLKTKKVKFPFESNYQSSSIAKTHLLLYCSSVESRVAGNEKELEGFVFAALFSVLLVFPI